jgi:hypothetical protein
MILTASSGATARPPWADGGQAPRQTSKEKFLYIKEKCYSLLGKYFCAMRIIQARKTSGSTTTYSRAELYY